MAFCKRLNIYNKNKEHYEDLARKTGVPPQVIAAIHYRESGCDFNTYLYNGDKLGIPTKNHPKGIIFYDFDTAALDALEKKEYARKHYNMTATTTDIAAMMSYLEEYNGLGYYNNGNISSYVYSGTNVYTGGKYTSDHHYDRNARDKQLVCIF